MTDLTSVGNVTCVTPSLIQVEITKPQEYEQLDTQLAIGSYIKVFNAGGPALVSVVRSYRIKDVTETPTRKDEESTGMPEQKITFILDTEPVGYLEPSGQFSRGGGVIAIPPQRIEILSASALRSIYAATDASKPFSFASLAHNSELDVTVDGNRFFGRHIGVVGSTGSGKSATVAKIVQRGIASGVSEDNPLNNSHVIFIDIHGEYASAFPSARVLTADSLALPYWLMNSEELVDTFIESTEENSYNQVSQFRQAILNNKRLHAERAGKDIAQITYDSPVFFDLEEVVNYISNLNSEVIFRGDTDPHIPRLADGTAIEDLSVYFGSRLRFITPVSSGGKKSTVGPFHGEFSRFIMRLEARLADERLSFLLKPKMSSGKRAGTEDREGLLRTYLSYLEANESNVTIFDLSGVPFEVLSIVVSLLSRLIFDVSFHYRRLTSRRDQELPVLVVLEEAHNYVPRDDSARFKSVKRSVERIAKEGRKYGISLMVVSQRPSEVSETIFSQCGNFVAMRLTNPMDQQYIKRLLPDSLGSLSESLAVLRQRQAILTGDAVPMPSIVQIHEVDPKPNSHDIDFLEEWERPWLDMDFTYLNALETTAEGGCSDSPRAGIEEAERTDTPRVGTLPLPQEPETLWEGNEPN